MSSASTNGSRDVAGRQRELAGEQRLAEVALAEVLAEPAAADDGPRRRPTCRTRLARCAAPPPRRGRRAARGARRPASTAIAAERADGLRRAGDGEVGEVGDVGGRTPVERRRPRRRGPPSRTAARAEREPTRTGSSRARSRSTTRRPVLPVPPSTSDRVLRMVVIVGPFVVRRPRSRRSSRARRPRASRARGRRAARAAARCRPTLRNGACASWS